MRRKDTERWTHVSSGNFKDEDTLDIKKPLVIRIDSESS